MLHVIRYYKYLNPGDTKAVRFVPDIYSDDLPMVGYGVEVQVALEGEEPKTYRIGSIPRMRQIPHVSIPGQMVLLHEALLVSPEDWQDNPSSIPVVGGD